MEETQFKALPPAQRKAHQQRLQALGLYTGAIDGNWGAGTAAAFQAENKRIADEAERARQGKIQEQSASAEAELKSAQAKGELAAAAEGERKTKLRQQRAEDESSAWGVTAKTLSGAPAALGGVWVGREMGKGINYYMDESQKSKNKTLQGLADDRRSGLTTTKGARAAAQYSGAMPSKNSVLRVGGRMLPHAGLGGFMAGKGAYMLADEDPEGSFYPETINRAAGLGMIGAGTGIAERGIMYGVAPGQVPDARSLAIIESDQLRRGKAAPAAGGGLTPKQMLVAEAKAAGIKNVGKMNMGQLQSALSGATKSLPKAGVLGPLAIPAAAGAFAFGMTPERAEASADGSAGGSNTGEALTNAAGAAGATYGASRGLGALARYAPTAMKAAGGALRMLNPAMAVDMTDGFGEGGYDPNSEEEQIKINRSVRHLPFTRHLLQSHSDAYDKAQVPPRSPANAGPRVQNARPSFEQALADFQALISAQ